MQASRGEAARGGGGAAPPDPPSAPPDLPSRPAPAPPQLSSIVADGMRLVSTFSHDELVMAVVTLFPLVYGTLAALRWMSGTPTATAHRHRHDPPLSHAVPVRCPRSCAPPAGNTDQSRDDSSDGHRQQHSDAALSCVARQAATAATSSTLNHVTSKLASIEKHVTHSQQSHDSRFADLNKDLAGIVWEVSKLRAELSRVRQQQAQPPPSAAPPDLARPAAAAPGEPPGAFGARSWRGGSNC